MKLRKLNGIFLSTVLFTALLTVSCYNTTFASTTVQSGSKRYIIKFKTSTTNEKQVVSKYSGGFKQQFKHFNVSVADMTPKSLASLKKDSNVDYVEEDGIVKISSTSTSVSSLSTSLTDWGVSDIKAPASWQSGITGKGIKIAIIDTGAGPNSDLTVTGGTNVISGSTTTSYADDNGHGTHVAGIIAAQGLNGGVEGVAPGASIYAVKALDSTGSGYTSDIISGIDWAIDNKVDIISMSLGSSQSDVSLQSAVDTAYSDGILVVAAAGNDGNTAGTGTNVEYPANYSSVIAVGAVDSTNTRAYFSSTGSKVEVSAPGVDIESTYLNNGYEQMSGTSMATPFVAGDLALLKQEYASDTNVQLRQLLDNNVSDLGASGRDALYGFGLIVAPSNTTSVTTSMPIASIAAGTYTSNQTVSLSDATAGVSIYYTTDGTTPTSNSKLYSEPITVSSTETLKAIAIATDGDSSAVSSVDYTISQSVVVIPVPTANILAGSYKSPLLIRLHDQYSKPLRAFYTIDGSTPTTKSLQYRGYISITSTCTLKVIAVDSYGNISQVLSNTYTISKHPSNPPADRNGGMYNRAESIKLSHNNTEIASNFIAGRIITPSNVYTLPITIKSNIAILGNSLGSISGL